MKIVANAVVYFIEADNKGVVQAVHYLDKNKPTPRVTGKQFVLTANELESPKILLLSKSERYPDGIANRSGLVGCKLMDHPGSSVVFVLMRACGLVGGPCVQAKLIVCVMGYSVPSDQRCVSI